MNIGDVLDCVLLDQDVVGITNHLEEDSLDDSSFFCSSNAESFHKYFSKSRATNEVRKKLYDHDN